MPRKSSQTSSRSPIGQQQQLPNVADLSLHKSSGQLHNAFASNGNGSLKKQNELASKKKKPTATTKPMPSSSSSSLPPPAVQQQQQHHSNLEKTIKSPPPTNPTHATALPSSKTTLDNNASDPSAMDEISALKNKKRPHQTVVDPPSLSIAPSSSNNRPPGQNTSKRRAAGILTSAMGWARSQAKELEEFEAREKNQGPPKPPPPLPVPTRKIAAMHHDMIKAAQGRTKGHARAIDSKSSPMPFLLQQLSGEDPPFSPSSMAAAAASAAAQGLSPIAFAFLSGHDPKLNDLLGVHISGSNDIHGSTALDGSSEMHRGFDGDGTDYYALAEECKQWALGLTPSVQNLTPADIEHARNELKSKLQGYPPPRLLASHRHKSSSIKLKSATGEHDIAVHIDPRSSNYFIQPVDRVAQGKLRHAARYPRRSSRARNAKRDDMFVNLDSEEEVARDDADNDEHEEDEEGRFHGGDEDDDDNVDESEDDDGDDGDDDDDDNLLNGGDDAHHHRHEDRMYNHHHHHPVAWSSLAAPPSCSQGKLFSRGGGRRSSSFSRSTTTDGQPKGPGRPRKGVSRQLDPQKHGRLGGASRGTSSLMTTVPLVTPSTNLLSIPGRTPDILSPFALFLMDQHLNTTRTPTAQHHKRTPESGEPIDYASLDDFISSLNFANDTFVAGSPQAIAAAMAGKSRVQSAHDALPMPPPLLLNNNITGPPKAQNQGCSAGQAQKGATRIDGGVHAAAAAVPVCTAMNMSMVHNNMDMVVDITPPTAPPLQHHDAAPAGDECIAAAVVATNGVSPANTADKTGAHHGAAIIDHRQENMQPYHHQNQHQGEGQRSECTLVPLAPLLDSATCKPLETPTVVGMLSIDLIKKSTPTAHASLTTTSSALLSPAMLTLNF